MAIKIQFMVFWVVVPCNAVVGCHRFGGPCCLHLQRGLLKRWYSTTTLYGVTTQKNSNLHSRENLKSRINVMSIGNPLNKLP